MRFPSIKDVASELRGINENVEGECDVRLCVWSDGQWCMRSGLVDYDSSHSDYCGAASVPGVVKGKVQRFSSVEVARTLLEQCREQYADSTAEDSYVAA